MIEIYKFVCDFLVFKLLVWWVISELELVLWWYGFGVEIVFYVFDLWVGGEWLMEMKMQQGVLYQCVDFIDVIDGEGYVCIQV